MDADGEDRPEELSLLIEKINDYPDIVVTANRIKRSEGLAKRSRNKRMGDKERRIAQVII